MTRFLAIEATFEGTGARLPGWAMPECFRLAPFAFRVQDCGVSSGSVPAISDVGTGDDAARDDAIDRSDRAASTQVDFDAVFRRYAPYVGVIALRLVGRAQDVDDIVQDVFIQAHRGLSGLRDPEAVRAWLTRIAVRRSRRWLRRHWYRRLAQTSDASAFDDIVDPQASPEQRAEVSIVYAALAKMPTDERVVWVLRTVDGETLEAIADLVGCSLSTVQRRFRAAQAMMERLR